jgi:hypothetical protein
MMIGIDKFKPLRPERTQVMVDRDSGEYAGLRNGKVDLLPEQTLHVTYDLEDDDWYGRSRLENIRTSAWWPWLYLLETATRLGRKVSNIIPIVSGPLGATDVDEAGNTIRGTDVAQLILDALTYGDGVMVESLMGAVEDLRAVPELVGRSPWDVKAFDTGSSSSAIGGIEAMMRYFDSLKMRGMLRPERAAIEGQFGTKAEAETHADVGLIEGDKMHGELLEFLNRHSVDRLVEWNFGPEWVGSVYVAATPLADEVKQLYRWLWEKLMEAPGTLDLIASNLNLDAIAERLEVPVTGPMNPDLQGEDFNVMGDQGGDDEGAGEDVNPRPGNPAPARGRNTPGRRRAA